MPESKSSNSISSVKTDASTLIEVTWPGALEVENNASIGDQQRASESLSAMIQALGSEKMAKIRFLIAMHQQNVANSLLPPRPNSTCPVGTSSTSPNDSPEQPTDEVALTISHLESALGPEDMAELRDSMISVRRQSIHLDLVISSDMAEEELQHRVDAVRNRQDDVLEQLYQGILDLVAAKLGIEDAQASEPVRKEVIKKLVKRDESSMLKVPEVDLTGRRASTSTMSTRKKETLHRPKKFFDGYSLSFYGGGGPGKNMRVGEAQNSKGKGKTQSSGSIDEKSQEKKKQRRGCFGFCTLM